MLEPTEAPEIPEDLRLGLKKLVDEQAGYLEQTWTLMRRQGRRHLDAHPNDTDPFHVEAIADEDRPFQVLA